MSFGMALETQTIIILFSGSSLTLLEAVSSHIPFFVRSETLSSALLFEQQNNLQKQLVAIQVQTRGSIGLNEV